MKYRNGATNIGVMCGFAVPGNGNEIVVHQNSCREMGYRMTLADGARLPTHDFEPVTVIFRLEPAGDAAASMVALHVTRMARHMVPKTMYWNSREWAITHDFYPFRKDKAGTLTDELLEQLVDAHDFPQWLIDAANEDDSLAALLAKPASNKALQSRALITGFLSFGQDYEVPEEVSAHGYSTIFIRQPKDEGKLTARLNPGMPGYWSARKIAEHQDRVPVTVAARPYMLVECEEGAEAVKSVELCLRLLEVNAVAPEDIQQAA